jgi:hypothetical protein
MGKIVRKETEEVESYNSRIGKKYIEENLTFFIEKEEELSRCVLGNGWHINYDENTQLRYLLLDYILAHFNLYELYTIFFQQDCYLLSQDIITKAREIAIKNINNDDSFTPEEVKRIKRKVWDMNPILFGLILKFIHESNLFWDADENEIVFPDYY